MSSAADFLRSLAKLTRFPDRENAIRDYAIAGGMVKWPTVDVALAAPGMSATCKVASDVFALGTPVDFVRVPLSPITAQAIADHLGMTLTTRAISDATWRAAKAIGDAGAVVLDPMPMGPPTYPYDASMLSVERFLVHNDWIEKKRAGRRGLVVGHKKDVVLCNRLQLKPTSVGLYGWHAMSGKPIQPLETPHESSYADYSHGIRFVEKFVRVQHEMGAGEAVMTLEELSAEPEWKLAPDVDPQTFAPAPLRVFRQPGALPDHVPIAELTSRASLSSQALLAALGDLDQGIHETPPGSNDGPVIREYLKAVGVGPHNEWCASAVSAWLRAGARAIGRPSPVAGSAGALMLGQQLQKASQAPGGGVRWSQHPKLEELLPGMVVVWQRPEAGPGKGHIGLVHSAGAEHFWTVEGNVGDWVAMREHALSDPHLVGFAYLA